MTQYELVHVTTKEQGLMKRETEMALKGARDLIYIKTRPNIVPICTWENEHENRCFFFFLYKLISIIKIYNLVPT